MSIASELTNLEGNIEDSYDAVNDMGGVIPAQRNMDNLDQAIRTIPQNQGTTYTAGTGIDITSDVISVDNTTVPFFTDLATVATTGDYGDLLNTPTIPAAQVNSDWNANSGVAEILNKPTIPTVNDATLTITQNGTTAGTFSANASSAATIALTDTTYSAFGGATSSVAGSAGLVPAPTTSDPDKFLKGDGTWATPTDTTYTAGTNVQISAQNVISATDTTYSVMTGATSGAAGTSGLVPAPAAGDESKVLSGAGTWVSQTAAQVNSDWNAVSGVAQILNKPTIITPLDIYPVGAIYMSVNNTNPGTLFGGTWEQIKDRFILAAGTTYAGGATGGSATINIAHSHTVNSHNHSLPANTGSHTLTVDQIPAHTHAVAYQWNTGTGSARWGVSDSFGTSTPSGSTGGGKGHSHSIGGNTGDKSPGTNSKLSSTQSILPPYLAVYVWKRTA